MKTKHLLITLLALCVSAVANAYEIGGIYYDISGTTATVTRGEGSYSGNVTIPETINYNGSTYSVTEIGENAFLGCSGLTSITIPNSVTEIRYGAFWGCKGLTSVTIPNSVTSIGSTAFYCCEGLTSITIPNSVTEIGNQAFDICSGLESIIVEAGNTRYDSRDNCNAIIETSSNTLIAGCKNTIIPNNVTSIGHFAFEGCTGLTSVTIPNSVTWIGDYAFSGCLGLTSITIPNSVTEIGGGAFSGCSGLTSVNIPNSVTEIGSHAFYWCTGLTSITIPNSVTEIRYGAFWGCTGLTSVTIPNSVTSIGKEAFYGCSGLTSITIPNSVTEIGGGAFRECTGLTSISIPNSVTEIGFNPFGSCSGLESIIVEAGNTKYDSRDNCNAIIETSSNTLITGCKNTIIPNSVTSIGEYAFSLCTGLTSITIPNSVTSIGERAFSYCYGLTSITIPNSVTEIGEGAFFYCSGLTSVTCYAESVPTTDEYAFWNSPISSATLYVPAKSLAAYAATSPWNGFGSILPIASSFALNDGESYTHDKDTEYDEITYTRNFTNTLWQALYVPFPMKYDDWKSDFEVARINNLHQWDDDDNGTIDRTKLEVVKMKSGKTEANTPYLIRAKSVGEKTITLTNTTLYKAEERSIDCSSIGTKFTFTGTYSGVSGTEMFANGYYAMGGGTLHQTASSANDLSPMRWYMTVTDRNGNPKSLGEVKVMFFDTTDGISPTENAEKTENTEVYDLAGRRTEKPTQKGIYIRNGRKVIVR